MPQSHGCWAGLGYAMARVGQVFNLKPRLGRLNEFMKDAGHAAKIVRRNGDKVRFLNYLAGGEAGGAAFVVETADWKSFGEYAAELEADPKWQAFLAQLNSDLLRCGFRTAPGLRPGAGAKSPFSGYTLTSASGWG